MTDHEKGIPDLIKLIRSEADMTQQELAEAINVSPVYVSNMETGLKKPSPKTLFKIISVSDKPEKFSVGVLLVSDESSSFFNYQSK